MRVAAGCLALTALAGCRESTKPKPGAAVIAPIKDSIVEGSLAAPSVPVPARVAAAPGIPLPADRSWERASPVRRRLGSHSSGVLAVAFHPDGVRALSSAVAEEAIIWDLRSGGVVRRFKGPAFRFNHVAFSPDGHRALTAGYSPRYWDLDSGRDVYALQGTTQDPADVVFAVAIAPSGKLGAAAMPGVLSIWDLRSGLLVRSIPFVGQVLALRYAVAEDVLQTVTDRTLCDVDITGTDQPRCVDLSMEPFGRLSAGATDGTTTLVGNSDGEVFSLNRANGAVSHRAKPLLQRGVLTLTLSSRPYRALVTGERSAFLLNARNLAVISRLGPFASYSSVGALSETGGMALIAEEQGDLWLLRLAP